MTTQIALFLPNLGGGGAERMMVNLAHGLVSEGIKVDLVLASATGPYLKEVSQDLNIVDLQAQGVLKSIPALAAYLRRTRPRIMLSTLQYANLAALWARRLSGVPTRVFLREANMLSVGGVSSPKNKLILSLVKRFYPWADSVIAVSDGVGADVGKFTGMDPDKIRTIYNPVVTEELLLKRLEPVPHPWFTETTPVILGVGRLTEQKGFATLVRAFAELRQTRPARLVILGEGEDRAALQSLVGELGLTQDVDMPGFVDNPFAYMANASVFALSSAWEGLPGVLIQALACGCPVVSTNCPSGPSEVLDGGRYGELVPVGDAGALAAALLRTLESPISAEKLTARAQAFSVAASTRAYLEVFGF